MQKNTPIAYKQKVIDKTLTNEIWLYKLEDTNNFVISSASLISYYEPETIVYPSDSKGNICGKLLIGISNYYDCDGAIEKLGYVVKSFNHA